jgi:hypothetical protein
VHPSVACGTNFFTCIAVSRAQVSTLHRITSEVGMWVHLDRSAVPLSMLCTGGSAPAWSRRVEIHPQSYANQPDRPYQVHYIIPRVALSVGGAWQGQGGTSA